MIWLIPLSLHALLWLWVWLRRRPELDFDDIRDVELALWGTIAVWVAFFIYLSVLA